MRRLTKHVVSGDQAVQLNVLVLDEPGSGGANHTYSVSDDEGNALHIHFQQGPIKENGVNGITNEALIAFLIDRMEGFQSGQYACQDNSLALSHLEHALTCLQKRTVERIARGVEGTLQH